MRIEDTTADATAQGAADEGRVAFRVVGDTQVYESPDPSARVLAVLPPGSLLTVREDAGEFLYVITPNDTFGYILDGTPVTPMLRSPGIDRRPVSAAVLQKGESPLTARGVMEQTGMAALGTLNFIPKSRLDDPNWQPALPLNMSERILIYDRIAANKRSTVFLIAGFVLFMGVFFGAVGAFFGFQSNLEFAGQAAYSLVIGGIAAAIALVVGIIMYFSATSAVLAIAGGHQVTKGEEPVLYRIVENLSIGSGLPMPKVWVIEDSAPNAFATGRNPKMAHVAATRGLLDKLEKRELEAVMAHELSHVGNYDTRLMTIVAVAVGIVAMTSDLLLRFTRYGAGTRSSNRDKGGGALALVIIVVAVVLIAVAPIIAGVMRLAMSRRREYLADSSGALLCRNPDALADALEKIAGDREPLEVANKATAHLYITNPLKGHESFLNNLFSTHPPVEERVRILRAMA